MDKRVSKLLHRSEIGGRGIIIRFECDATFIPGQVIGISTENIEMPRWYSIASSPFEPYYEVLFTQVDGGELTPELACLPLNSEIFLHGPRGQFTDLEPPLGGICFWIANGTGITPYLSMRSSKRFSGRHIIHGCRSRDETFGREKILGLVSEKLTYTICLSQEQEPQSKFEFIGRLTSFIKAQNFSHLDRFMLCGSIGMIIEVREILTQKGIHHDAILSEVYF